MELGKVKRSAWEYFFIGTVVGCSMLLSIGLYAKRDHLYKSRLMGLELLTLRNAVTAYTLEHRKHPSSLEEASGPWSMVHSPLSDPFGNLYQYDAKTGWVYSLTSK